MARDKTKLELTWIGKENRPRLEPKYAGRLSISLELYRQWKDAFLATPLFSEEYYCKDDIFSL